MHPWRSEEDAGCPALPLCLTPLRQGLTELHVFSPEHALISEPQHWHWRLARIFFFFFFTLVLGVQKSGHHAWHCKCSYVLHHLFSSINEEFFLLKNYAFF